jgi:hypothetical protein
MARAGLGKERGHFEKQCSLLMLRLFERVRRRENLLMILRTQLRTTSGESGQIAARADRESNTLD